MGTVIDEIRPGGVGCLVMRDPAGRNPFDEHLRATLDEHLRAMFANGHVRSIVIGSDGPNFSVGGDLSRLCDHATGQTSYRMMKSVNELALLVGTAPKPIVAAILGHCLGAGAGLALLCDTIVMGRTAAIGFPFLKLGLVPDFGVSYSLARRIGHPAARQALINARTFSADEALAAGLADVLAEDEDVWTRALAIGKTLAAAPAPAMHQIRAMLRDAPASLAAALDAEALNQSICLGSEDLHEGIAAFREKRKPDFIGPTGA